MIYTERQNCRLCGGALTDVLDLGSIYLSTFLDVDADDPEKAPLTLTVCDACTLVQLRHTVDKEAMYREYWYQSGLNTSMVRALKDVVDKTLQIVDLNPGDVVVDIGSNDGTLLRQYPKELGAYRVAFEPSNLAQLGYDAADLTVEDYFNAHAYMKHNLMPAKVVTSIAMFYDLEDPHTFIDDVRSILAERGVWVIQMMDLVSMFQTGDFANMCHEHTLYYSLAVLKNLLDSHGMTIFDLEYNNVNGGSLRVYVGHASAVQSVSARVDYTLAAEEEYFGSLFPDPFAYFRHRVTKTKEDVVAFIKQEVARGKKVAVMGASTKGNTILQYYGVDHTLIDHAAEVNPDKFGRFTSGTHIPIIDEKESLARHPDYYFILPWGFLANFIKRNEAYLKSGGKFLVPLPYPAVHAWELGKMRQNIPELRDKVVV